mmetsp:Transcript_7072/g.14274  ORF Transcript_7072/g.14274 Transcript_7072/m.14274 type:complete len:89 (-) Transcript_7072:305-571(-)
MPSVELDSVRSWLQGPWPPQCCPSAAAGGEQNASHRPAPSSPLPVGEVGGRTFPPPSHRELAAKCAMNTYALGANQLQSWESGARAAD